MRNVSLITGLSLDKRDCAKYYSEMAKDRDLKDFLSLRKMKASIRKKSSWKRWGVPILLSSITIVITVLGIISSIGWALWLAIISGVCTAINIILESQEYKKLKIRGKGFAKTDRKYKKINSSLIRFHNYYKIPMDIWQMFTSNISDAQTLQPFTANVNNTSLYYTGKPYYDTRFIDSIYLDFKAREKNDVNMELYGEIAAHARDILESTMDEMRLNYLNEFHKYKKDNELFQDENNNFSGHVFGIKFLSLFLYNFQTYLQRVYNTNNYFSTLSFYIERIKDIETDISIKDINEEMEKESSAYYEALKQLIDLSTDYRALNWERQNNGNALTVGVSMTPDGFNALDYYKYKVFTVFNILHRWNYEAALTSVSMLENNYKKEGKKELIGFLTEKFAEFKVKAAIKKQKKAIKKAGDEATDDKEKEEICKGIVKEYIENIRNMYIPKSNVIRIPIKRLIAVPEGNGQGYLPQVILDNLQRYSKDDAIFYVGGAEHNLALLCAIRQYRRSFYRRGKLLSPYIGILENKFDYEISDAVNGHCPLLLSCEKLVQAFYIREYDVTDQDIKHQHRAKKFNLSYSGELCSFELNGIKLYMFFGYSAPMTKVISEFLSRDLDYYLEKVNKEEYINRNILLLYNDSPKGSENRVVYNWPALKIKWDKKDMINHANEYNAEDAQLILINDNANIELYNSIKESAFGHNKYYDERDEGNYKLLYPVNSEYSMEKKVSWDVTKTENVTLGRFEIIMETLGLESGKEGYYSFINFKKQGICILPVLKTGEILMIEQYRRPFETWLYELPAGTVDKGEAPEETARRELLEETGYAANHIKDCGYFYPSPGSTNERINLFTAYCTKVGEPSPEESEHISIAVFRKEGVLKLLEENRIQHAAAIILLQKYLAGKIN